MAVTGAEMPATLKTLTSKAKYGDLAFSPYWVGQSFKVTLTGGGTGVTAAAGVQIESIAFQSNANDTDGSLVLTFNAPVITAAGTPTAIKLVPINIDGTYSIDAPEIVMSLSNEKPPDMFEVLSFHTEADSGASGDSINKVYQVAPNAINVVVLSPVDEKGRSDFNEMNTYRFRVDNKDVVDRAVGGKMSIHYGILTDLYKRMGMSLLNIRQKMEVILNDSIARKKDNQLIGCPLPDNNMPKLVDIEINSVANKGPASLIVFSQIIKQF